MKKIIYIILALIFAVSCSKSDAPVSNQMEFMFSIGNGATKVTTTGKTATFDIGDAVSLYAVEWDRTEQMPLQVSGNYLNNEKISYNGTNWTSLRTLYWSDNPCDFYALYPYQASFSSIEKQPFSVILDQNTGDGYDKSDLMYAYAENKSRTDGPVAMNFNHIMSKVVVNLVKGENFDGEIPSDAVAHVYSTITDCYVNMTSGSIEKDVFANKNTITMKKISNDKFEAIVVPQNLEKRTPLIEISMGGIAYLLETSLSFRAGYQHTITLTLNTSPDQEMIEISIDPGIQGWN
ncbi:MAG: fimbrillin family protein [Bacteroidales bacterium]|nr:fimbrillin family protein [Bacteroidales bacterium]